MPKWDDKNYVLVYEMARSGHNNAEIGRALSCTYKTWSKWVGDKPALKDALEKGREARAGAGAGLREYIYKRLPKSLQRLWDEINELENDPNAYRRMEAVLTDAGLRARQHLFLYALTASNYNPSKACRKVNISQRVLRQWLEDDAFRELMDEVEWHKKNFFEESLVRRLKEGDTLAAIYVNKTYNRDRGYNDKQQIEVTSTVNHNYNVVAIDALDLSIEVRRELLAAMRALAAKTGVVQPALAAPGAPHILDVDSKPAVAAG